VAPADPGVGAIEGATDGRIARRFERSARHLGAAA